MIRPITLDEHLERWADDEPGRGDVVQALRAIAAVSVEVSELIAEGGLAGDLDRAVGENVDGDIQKALDVQANERFIAALRKAPVAVLGSEESDDAMVLGEGSLAVNIDPLDGSSNIATNVSVGSIFSLLPATPGLGPRETILQPGHRQIGAGFVVYGPQTTLALTLRQGTHLFTLSRRNRRYWQTHADLAIPPERAEYAINGSNYRHWRRPIREYIDACQAGKEGPRGRDYNTRWVASLVAEAWRIFSRGGVFLYPGDARPGYENGRLRLVYEANPISLLVEQAGGLAIDGQQRILECEPREVHQRIPFIFGSREEVEQVRARHRSA